MARAPALHAGGRRFDSCYLHLKDLKFYNKSVISDSVSEI